MMSHVSPPQASPNAAQAFLGGLEACYGVSVEAIALRFRGSLMRGQASFDELMFDDFLNTYAEQVQQVVSTAPPPKALARGTSNNSLDARKGAVGRACDAGAG